MFKFKDMQVFEVRVNMRIAEQLGIRTITDKRIISIKICYFRSDALQESL